jgi:hypothetical protein
MGLQELLTALGEAETLAVVGRGWGESDACFSADACRQLLSEPFIDENALFAGLGGERARFLTDAARRLRGAPGLDRIFWHCHRTVYRSDAPGDLRGWPKLHRAMEDNGGAFYLLVGLAGVPDIRGAHRQRGIPQDVTAATCRQFLSFSEAYERGHAGRPGLYHAHQLLWLRNYVRHPYYRLGRLEFWLKQSPGGIDAWRHRRTGQVLALAEDGKKLNREGYIDGSASPLGSEGAWTARLTENEHEVVGYPYSPLGMALQRQVRLPLTDWEPVLRKDSWVLDMHIPAGGGMTPEACLDSHRMALEFFDRHHPGHPWTALVCRSWIFNTQLEQLLPAEANMVRYMRDLYLFPLRSSGTDGLWNIFLQEPFDIRTAPRASSLQRAVIEFLEAGNAWRSGAMFMLREHLHLIGAQHYRRNWSKALEAAGLLC